MNEQSYACQTAGKKQPGIQMWMDDWLCLFLEQLYTRRGGVSSEIGKLGFANVLRRGFWTAKIAKEAKGTK